jgi:hypothetical protein
VIVSPVTLKPRFNSAATGPEAARGDGELPAQVDPRQMSLFGAGWTVGSLARLIESGASSLTYYETTGWRGVIQGDEPPPLPDRFPAEAGVVFPVYHVFADLAEWREGAAVATRTSDPANVEALAVRAGGALHLLAANLTPVPQTTAIHGAPAGDAAIRRLNAENARDAAFAPGRFRAQTSSWKVSEDRRLTLAPFEIVRLDFSR